MIIQHVSELCAFHVFRYHQTGALDLARAVLVSNKQIIMYSLSIYLFHPSSLYLDVYIEIE